MFTLTNLIPNEAAPSLINEVCFDPDGSSFAAAYEYNNEVRIYDARSLAPTRVFRNPEAMLNRPHGILLTRKHLIVANKGAYPSPLQIFRLDGDCGTPVQTYTPPYAHLAEGHSIALHGRRLVVSYCEGAGKEGALVSYDYDDASGQISGPLDKLERWFSPYGDTKGISFDESGSKIYVTFQSDLMPWRQVALRRMKNALSLGRRGGASRNGIAVFSIDQQGRFSRRPLWKKVYRSFCRLENIHVHGGRAVVADPDGACVQVYRVRRDGALEKPQQVIRDDLVFPHGAKLSPDGSLLLVADNGIETVNHRPQWNTFASPRKDRLLLFRLQSA